MPEQPLDAVLGKFYQAARDLESARTAQEDASVLGEGYLMALQQSLEAAYDSLEGPLIKLVDPTRPPTKPARRSLLDRVAKWMNKTSPEAPPPVTRPGRLLLGVVDGSQGARGDVELLAGIAVAEDGSLWQVGHAERLTLLSALLPTGKIAAREGRHLSAAQARSLEVQVRDWETRVPHYDASGGGWDEIVRHRAVSTPTVRAANPALLAGMGCTVSTVIEGATAALDAASARLRTETEQVTSGLPGVPLLPPGGRTLGGSDVLALPAKSGEATSVTSGRSL